MTPDPLEQSPGNAGDGGEASERFLIPANHEGKRLDHSLTELLLSSPPGESPRELQITRSQVAKWIASGRVTVNGRESKRPAYRVQSGDRVAVRLPEVEPSRIAADSTVELDVVYEDDAVLVLNKPAGMVVHPGAGHRSRTLAHGVVGRYGDSLVGAEKNRPGIVHRLDKDTTGLMVVAKTDRAYHSLVRQFQPPRAIARDYLALTLTPPHTGDGTIELPIGRHHRDRKRMTVTKRGGREARTHWRVEEQLRHGVLLRLTLATGRTHQIRVHLRAAGAPIVGDQVYGPPIRTLPPRLRPYVTAFQRQALHAAALSFLHPETGERLQFSLPPPDAMLELIDRFRNDEF